MVTNEWRDRFVSQIVINWIGRIVASYIHFQNPNTGEAQGCGVLSLKVSVSQFLRKVYITTYISQFITLILRAR
jgi:hypothetical protein